MLSSLIDTVSKYMGWEDNITLSIAAKAPVTYRRYLVKKHSGGYRTIYHPSKQTKSIQYALIDTMLKNFSVHESAKAYLPTAGSPIKINADLHKRYSYTVRLDIKDFFPSIKPNDLLRFVESRGHIDDAEKRFLTNALFVKHPIYGFSLAIGAPSSPMISNIVMLDIDKAFTLYAARFSSLYTRYADDLVFSTNRRGLCKDFEKYAKKTFKNCKSPIFFLNEKKTLFMSRGTRRVVTGMYLTHDGETSLGRKNKRYVKKLIYDFINDNTTPESINYLRGYLSFVLDVEPSFYNRVVIKYGGDVISRIRKYDLK